MEVSEFISGGYYVVKPVSRPEVFSTLLPRNILTLSSCIAEIAPDFWAVEGYKYTEEKRTAEAFKFGIPASLVPEMTKWVTAETHYWQPMDFLLPLQLKNSAVVSLPTRTSLLWASAFT